VVPSDALDRRRERTLQRDIADEATALRTAVARQVFACVADTEAAHAVALKAAASRWHAVTPTVVAETVVLETDARGRSASDLVAAHKGQPHAEQAFRWAKQPWHGDACYLQNPERVAGLGFLLLLALQCVRAMRPLARAAFRDQPPWALPDGRKIAAPADGVLCQDLRPLWLRRQGTAVRPWYPCGHVAPPCNNSWRRSSCRSTSALNGVSPRGPPTSFEKSGCAPVTRGS
jgi:hypothetical protein